MIAHLTGKLSSKAPDHCVIDVNGVGYRVTLSLSTFSALPGIGEPVSLTIHTHVREDQLTLYGFGTAEERSLFTRLISISGVGPKTALALLAGLSAAHLIETIGSEDMARLATIPGVGKKTAERIVVELKDKLARNMLAFSPSLSSSSSAGGMYEDALSALTNLGYHRSVAENALKKSGWSDKMRIEEGIRLALKELCRA